MQQGSQASVTGWDSDEPRPRPCMRGSTRSAASIAAAVGITERAAHRIVSELVEEGYVLRKARPTQSLPGRWPGRPMRHPLVQEREVGDLLEVLLRPARPARRIGHTGATPASGDAPQDHGARLEDMDGMRSNRTRRDTVEKPPLSGGALRSVFRWRERVGAVLRLRRSDQSMRRARGRARRVPMTRG